MWLFFNINGGHRNILGYGWKFLVIVGILFYLFEYYKNISAPKPLLYTSQLVLRIEILLGSVQEAAFGEGYVSEFCGETYSEVWQGKPRVAVVSDQINLWEVPSLGI